MVDRHPFYVRETFVTPSPLVQTFFSNVRFTEIGPGGGWGVGGGLTSWQKHEVLSRELVLSSAHDMKKISCNV